MSRDAVVRCDLCQELIDTTATKSTTWVEAADYNRDYHLGCLTDDMKAIIRSLGLNVGVSRMALDNSHKQHE